jgi:hypothetical protein
MQTSDYIKTLVCVGLVLCLLLPKAFGSLFAWFVVWFAVWLLYNAVRAALKPDERKKRGIRIALWLATVLLVGAVQFHRESSVRDDADKAARAILDHKVRTGAYPRALAEAGVDDAALQREWSLTYELRGGKPALYYPAIIMPLSTYSFDFDQRRWHRDSY